MPNPAVRRRAVQAFLLICSALSGVAHGATLQPSAMRFVAAPNPAVFGQSVMLTANLTPSTATGTVVFRDGDAILGSTPVVAASSPFPAIATFSTASLTAGAHSLTATYSGDLLVGSSSSSPVSITVTKSVPTLMLSSSANPAGTGQTLTLTAAVSPSGASGSVSFFDGSALLGTGLLNQGTAAFSASSLAPGVHNLSASYSGDTNYAASTSGALSETVVVSPAVASVVNAGDFSAPPLAPGSQVSILGSALAGVSLQAGSLPLPTSLGNVSVMVNGVLAPVSFVSPGRVNFQLPYGTGTGMFPLVVTNAGVVSNSFLLAVVPAAPGFLATPGILNPDATVNSEVSPVLAGANVSVNLTGIGAVNPAVADGAATPVSPPAVATNTSSVTVGGLPATLGFLGLAAGGAPGLALAKIGLPGTLATGSYPVVITVNGVAGVAATVYITGKASTTATLTSSLNPATLGQNVTLTATVTPAAATGSVSFQEGDTVLGTAALSKGTATFLTAGLSVGMHSLTAVYAGDAGNSGSSSQALLQTVSQIPTSTSVTAMPNPTVFGQTVTFTATVFPSGATGTVTFKDGATALGQGTLAGGLATFSTAALTTGTHSITAAYGGDAADAASVSGVLAAVVNPVVTSTSFSTSSNPATVGTPLSLRAVVTPSAATGTVVFRDGVNVLGTAALSAGTASITVTGLSFGSHSLSAAYGGDLNDAPGTSLALNQSIVFPPLSLSFAGFPAGQAGQVYGPVSLTATGGSGVYNWSGSGLPSGLGVSAGGVVGGTPGGSYSGPVSITVTDGVSGLSASANYSLTIVALPLSISGPASLGSVLVGGKVSGSYTAAGGTPPYTWSVSGLVGVSVDASGNVTGAPGAAGTYSVTLTVTDSKSGSVSRTLSAAAFGITTGGLPAASTTADYGVSIAAAGGTPPYSFTISGLPGGISASGGTLSGRANAPGSYSVSVAAADARGLTATANYTLTVTGPAALKVFSSALGDATVGQAYSDSITATGGSTPYMWAQTGGMIPPGLSLSSSGAVTGMPSTPGTYSLGIQVSDGGGASSLGTVAIRVNPAPVKLTTGMTFPAGVTGLAYPSQILTATGGVPPYTFGMKGTLPAGLSLLGGVIGGTPSSSGDANFTLTVTDSASPPVTALLGAGMTIRPASPDVVLSSASLSFSVVSGGSSVPPPGSIGVASSLTAQSVSYSISTSAPWISLSGGQNTPDVVLVGLNTAALTLPPGGSPYSGTVTVSCTAPSCAGKSQSIEVTLTVAAPPPQLSLGTTLLSFAAMASNPQASSAGLTLVNAGSGSLKITSVTSDAGWLSVGNVTGPILPGPGTSVNVTADPSGLAPGYYRGTVSVVSSGGNASATVTLFISGAATMALGPAGRQLSMPQGGAPGNAAGSFSVSVLNGSVSVPFTAGVVSGSSWLQVSGGAGTATAANAGTVSYSIDASAAAALTTGAYYGTIRVTGTGIANSPQDFQVILNVTAADAPVMPDLQPAGLVFVSVVGAPASSQQVNVYAGSKLPLTFQASASTDDGGLWLGVSSAQGSASASAPGAVGVTANPAGLKAGAYRGIVSFSYGSSVRAVNVTLIVQPSQIIPSQVIPAQLSPALLTQAKPAASGPTCSGAQLVPTQTGLVSNFSAPTAWPTPLAIKLYDTCGSSVSNAQIVATFTNGDPPLPLTAINSNAGLYSGTWTPRKVATQLSITAQVTAPGYAATSVKIAGQVAPNGAPVLAPNATGDVFHPQVGAGLGPGNIVQIYGTGLASQTSSPATLPLPTAMNGTTVLIGGIKAPLFYISPTQINAQIPFELTPGNQYQLIVSANGAVTTPETIQLNGGTPAILNFSSGAVVAQHLDGTLILDSSPATPGELVVIYSSGLGATDVPVPSGAASPAEPPARVADTPVLTLSGTPVDVLFSGLTPGLVGLYQVNFQVPPDAKTGNYDVLLTQSGTASNKTVLSVQAPL